MKVRLAIAVALLSATAHAAQPAPADDWQPSAESMFDLLQNGYKLVAVVSSEKQPATTRTFYLQKDRTVAQCVEVNVAGRSSPTQRTCAELVQQYPAPPK
jgi:hypothetical protein